METKGCDKMATSVISHGVLTGNTMETENKMANENRMATSVSSNDVLTGNTTENKMLNENKMTTSAISNVVLTGNTMEREKKIFLGSKTSARVGKIEDTRNSPRIVRRADGSPEEVKHIAKRTFMTPEASSERPMLSPFRMFSNAMSKYFMPKTYEEEKKDDLEKEENERNMVLRNTMETEGCDMATSVISNGVLTGNTMETENKMANENRMATSVSSNDVLTGNTMETENKMVNENKMTTSAISNVVLTGNTMETKNKKVVNVASKFFYAKNRRRGKKRGSQER